jgi:CRP-like cAMP-binding protein
MFGKDGPTTASLAALAAHATAVRVPAGTEISQEGEPTEQIFLVLEGELKASRADKTLGFFGPRTGVGMLPVLARDPHGYSAVATRDTLALVLRAEDTLEMFEDHFEIMYSAMRGMARDAIELRRVLPNAGFADEPKSDPGCPPRALDLVERLLYMRSTFGLQDSHFDALGELAQAASEVRYPAGTLLWSAGETAEHMIVIVSGALRCETPQGQRFAFGAGEIVGSLDMIGGVPRWFDARVERELVGLSFDSDLVADIWEDQPDLSFDFLRTLARMLLSLRERVGPHVPSVLFRSRE